MSYENGIGKREEREEQQDSLNHIVDVCGKNIGGGDSGVSVKETAAQTLRLTTLFEGR